MEYLLGTLLLAIFMVIIVLKFFGVGVLIAYILLAAILAALSG